MPDEYGPMLDRLKGDLRKLNDPIETSTLHPSGCLAGTELKKLFSTLGLKPKAKCNCNKHARKMDESGCDWCEQHVDRIAGWIKHECRKMGIPFVKPVVVAAIRLAISRARKNAGAEKSTPA